MFILISIFIILTSLEAHQYHESYITIDYNSSKPSLEWQIEGDNLNIVLKNLDDNQNSIISWRELKNHREEILNYAERYIKIELNNKNLPIELKEFKLKRYDDQTYIVTSIQIPKKLPQNIKIDYNLFFEIDKLQKLIIKIYDKNSTKAYILSPNERNLSINFQKTTLFNSLKRFFVEGIWHILIGLDHILFLLMLILPSVKNQTDFKKVLIEIAKVVTAFSIAHSITLGLSALEIISISSKLVNVMIAVTVLLTALNNIFEKVKESYWQIAFIFGLIHGFGFANALGEFHNIKYFIYFLATFNIGIEFGQLMIVSTLLPILFIMRETAIYKKGILKFGSIVTALIAIYWIYVRI